MVQRRSAATAQNEERGADTNTQFYEGIAPIYDTLYEDVDAVEAVRQWSLLTMKCAGLPPQDRKNLPRLLDLGCGTGLYLEPWAEAGFSVTGVDGSHGMLSLARRRRSRSPRRTRIQLLYCDLRKRSAALAKAGPFDLAVAHFNFFNLLSPPELAKVLTNLASCMKDGAMLFTDCASPQLMPERDNTRMTLGNGEHIEINTEPDPATSTVVRSYGLRGAILSERYWLHSTKLLRATGAQAGWCLEHTYRWRPDRPDDPWRSSGNSRFSQRVCVLKLCRRRTLGLCRGV